MRLELRTGAIAAGGGCVARSPDGRVVFVRHALPGELVVAEVTAETTSYLRADAVEIVEAAPGRVAAPCPHAGPGRCGGCDFQHVTPEVQRVLKASLVTEQLQRLAGDDRPVVVEPAPSHADSLRWRTRVRFAVDRSGRVGLHAHRSHRVVPVEHCAIATEAVDGVGVGGHRWSGAVEVEVLTSGQGGTPVVSVKTGHRRLGDRPKLDAGRVVDGRTERQPHQLTAQVLGHRYRISTGVFWQVHPDAPELLVRTVLGGLGARPGDRVLDLYSGAGLFAVALAKAVGPTGAVTAVERSGRACADAVHNSAGLEQVEVVRHDVTAALVAGRPGPVDLVVLDPARQGAGPEVMEALASRSPTARRIAYVSCDPATFARDLRVMTDAGWSMPRLRVFDLFPMTEHVELVAVLVPPDTA